MFMTTVNARIYIARVLGGAASPNAIDLADEALRRGYSDWQTMRNWEFLLKDNSLPVTASIHTHSGNGICHPSGDVDDGSLDFINVGQTLTASNFTGTATILTITRSATGSITQFTVNLNASGTGNVTATFSPYMHITAGSNDYSLPLDCDTPYSARFITNSKRPLAYKNQRQWDRTQFDQTVQGTPAEYTIYSPNSEASQNFGTTRLKFDVVPAQADDLFLRYYRKFTVDGTYVDMHEKFLYAFLDYCRARALEAKRAQEDPAGYLREQKEQAEKSGSAEEEKEDNDDDYMKSQHEMGSAFNRPIVGNGDFWPTA